MGGLGVAWGYGWLKRRSSALVLVDARGEGESEMESRQRFYFSWTTVPHGQAARSIQLRILLWAAARLRQSPLQLASELKNCGNTVRSSSRCRIWYLEAGVLGDLTPSSTRWATVQPSSCAFLQFWYESSEPCQRQGPRRGSQAGGRQLTDKKAVLILLNSCLPHRLLVHVRVRLACQRHRAIVAVRDALEELLHLE